MKPVETPECNFTYHLPGGTEENDLPCRIDREAQTVVSFWELDAEELGRFTADARVVILFVWWTDHPSHITPLIGATLEGLRPPDASIITTAAQATEDQPMGIQFNFAATEEERNKIAETGHVLVEMNRMPTPPVAVWVDRD